MLTNLGESVILATYREFETAAETLRERTAAWAASRSEADRTAAQQAWSEAIDVWQRAEVYQIGPAGVMGAIAGGEDLRDEIYSWPLVNPCRVDQELAERTYEDPAALAAEAVNVRGLDALEYLLFYDGASNACAPNATLNTSGAWAAMDDTERTARRAAYAASAAQLVAASATELRTAWDPAGGNFVESLASAHAGSAHYSGTQAALNALSDAMYYLETETKDMKLGTPTGLIGCSTETCPTALESKHAKRSKEHVRANLVGFREIFIGGKQGADGLGFDDLLRDVGQGELADEMIRRIDHAIGVIDAFEGNFSDVLATDRARVVEVFDAVKQVTDLLKTQFITVLNLEAPARAEGDND